MGSLNTAEAIEGGLTEYICVLCGSVWSSADYDWGARRDERSSTVDRRRDWSCPQCGGVVVEYARHVARLNEGKPTLARPHA